MMLRCECFRLGFLPLRRWARARGLTTLDEVMRSTRCGTRCGRCRPYVAELLRSGKLICGDQLIDLPDLPE